MVDPVPVDVDDHHWHIARTVPIEKGLFIWVVVPSEMVATLWTESAVIDDLSIFWVVAQYTVSLDI